ncbi:hypothetical protein [Polynucleobacter sp. AP-RePozz3-80-G7]|uniref:hypothetical protein n=1 Tax=Polynucleobacter sp. AP-RePozz3-80-G7 TaxID=2689105 RepID=UPI001C0E6573|nr:hypothetical protein [Polynucleobacter sp. AP-RePozz3-80-G7]MBU3640016.1 hypothetical protein [Polynucleobacter sp. AP-RePozz3-80-G7]
MTIPRLNDMNKYWEECPPVHVMLAHRFGITKKSSSETGLDEHGNSLFDFF